MARPECLPTPRKNVPEVSPSTRGPRSAFPSQREVYIYKKKRPERFNLGSEMGRVLKLLYKRPTPSTYGSRLGAGLV